MEILEGLPVFIRIIIIALFVLVILIGTIGLFRPRERKSFLSSKKSFEDNVLSHMEEQTKLQREMKRILSFFYWFTIISIVISLIGIFFI